MVRILQLNMLDNDDRRWLGGQTAQLMLALFRAAPKRALILYGGTLIALLLWLVPIRHKVRPTVTLSLTLTAAGILAATQSELERWQKQIEAAEADADYQTALHRQATEAVLTTQQYANVTAARLNASQVLPEYLIEPDLQDPKLTQAAEFEEFKRMIGAADSEDSSGQPTALLKGDTNSDGIIDVQQGKYRFYPRKNPQTGQKERCVDLTGHTHYAGLPIVDLASEMARESRGCLGVGPTGTGKTQLIKQAIAAQFCCDRTTDFTVFAHKSANTARGEKLDYCGLENSEDLYLLTASMSGGVLEEAAYRLYCRLRVLQGIMERGSKVPSVVVIDQINQGLVAANKAERYALRDDDGEILFPYLEQTYKDDLATLLVDGREKCVKAWVFGHANTNEALGLSHQIKENVFYVGLGRDGIYSAVTNPLKDDRFIAVPSVRKALVANLQAYFKAHEEYGNPVNVVLAITNCGSQGWRLVILPQLPDPDPIELGVTNPPATTPQAKPARPKPQPEIESVRDRLEIQLGSDLGQHYTAAQKTTATAFIRWIKQRRHDFIDAQGLLDPEMVSYGFDGVNSVEEMELILQLISELGYGSFEEHPHTGLIAWRLKGATPIGADPWLLRAPTPLPPPEKLLAEAGTPELAPLPDGITPEIFKTILFYLDQKQPGILLTPNGFLTGSYRLIDKDSPEKINTAQMRTALKYLDSLGVVSFPNLEDKQFRFLGFPEKPHTKNIPEDIS
ncbi:hypothetical protein [Leptothoe sp. PORK10 BA2]|uniref:hypothetical protein n=1 Tax=Leptothoe sp. PORK10 BA2 TaxID=3110254 RepID=UPI002B1EF2CF|nr:hypothetical protein [Leptothoe sp. PORK10 BA2]MEA5463615.1 hypothetical protein [Leptothoe sp. PORK10 BA2]